MFDDITDLDKIDLSDIKAPHNGPSYRTYDNNPSYKGPNVSAGQYQKNVNNGGFKKKEEVLEEPYLPVAVYVDRNFPPEVKTSLYNIISKLINKNITVRVNGDDKEFCNKVIELSSKYVEIYIPWKGFNEIDSPHYFNSLTSKEIARQQFSGWEKIPDSVKAMLARNVRMVFGDKNRSICTALITWSQDGASRIAEINKDTGRSSFSIKLAATYGFPVLNIRKEGVGPSIEAKFNY